MAGGFLLFGIQFSDSTDAPAALSVLEFPIMKILKFLRIILRLALVLSGAALVFTGLSHLPRLFLGIAIILVGILSSAILAVVIRKNGGEIPGKSGMKPRGTKGITRFLLQPEILIVIFGFFFNFWWEVSQIPMYTGINRGIAYFGENSVEMKLFFVETFWRAAFLDALLILGAYLLTSQIYQDRFWFIRGGTFLGKNTFSIPRWAGYVFTSVVCVAFLIYLEVSSFDQNLWEYSRLMPTLFTKIGLTPVGGLLISPSIVLLLSKRVFRGA